MPDDFASDIRIEKACTENCLPLGLEYCYELVPSLTQNISGLICIERDWVPAIKASHPVFHNPCGIGTMYQISRDPNDNDVVAMLKKVIRSQNAENSQSLTERRQHFWHYVKHQHCQHSSLIINDFYNNW